MYTTLWCGDCRRAKRVLAALGVPYGEVNIGRDPQAAERVRRLNGGMQSVPSIHLPDGSWLVEPSNTALEAKLRPYAAALR
jgi:mycoredoxin